MPNPFSLRRASFAAAFSVSVVTAACGARGPLDIVVVEEQPGQPDAGADVSASVDAPPNAPLDATPDAPQVGLPGFDAGGLASCGTCLAQNCQSQIVGCLTDSSCRSTLQCVATMCLAGGGANIVTCAYGCSGEGGIQSLGSIIGLFQCVTANCPSCGSALGGLLGGGGGGLPGG